MEVKIGQEIETTTGHILLVRTVEPDGSFTALSKYPLLLRYNKQGVMDPPPDLGAFNAVRVM